ncbi:TPA: site-specific integrase [Burkholderia vietnamiensis]|uniref:Site-specific integrase n=2 Tax=Burkholderiaceae TaxID=119060 RepID=A0ABY5BDX5_BURGL|nr:site-specific integrase [Burkholderia vietnamiensis]MCS6514633.1 site-specific integrase [Burkholderia thailandensis]USS45127.1 site-specific integrase [Burkholderia glumae]KVF07708.1 integrase [Burkholderia vietnamiensis]KVR80591.1 integrase [Burkholderia vietnamiensis]KVS24560.1 integrase [Burkholderia vietnamiensis]
MATIRQRGKYWEAQIRRRGWPSLSRSFDTKASAEAWARRAESEMDRGVFVDRTEADRNTFGDLLKRYAEEVSPQKKGGAGEILRIRKIGTDVLAQYKISAISGKVIADYRDRRLAKVSGSTVNRELTLIGHVLNVARKEWGVHLETNPVSIIRRPRENRARSRRLSPDEERRLLAELAPSPRDEQGRFEPGGSRNDWVRPVVVIAIETAMRRSEILSLRWADVFLEDRYVRLHDSKNGEARDVPLSSRAVATLSALPRHIDGRVFPITPDALKKVFVRACERARLENLHFHDLRHEATSRIAERLDNILELSAVTGHRTVQMLKRYYHPRATDLARKLG